MCIMGVTNPAYESDGAILLIPYRRKPWEKRVRSFIPRATRVKRCVECVWIWAATWRMSTESGRSYRCRSSDNNQGEPNSQTFTRGDGGEWSGHHDLRRHPRRSDGAAWTHPAGPRGAPSWTHAGRDGGMIPLIRGTFPFLDGLRPPSQERAGIADGASDDDILDRIAQIP